MPARVRSWRETIPRQLWGEAMGLFPRVPPTRLSAVWFGGRLRVLQMGNGPALSTVPDGWPDVNVCRHQMRNYQI